MTTRTSPAARPWWPMSRKIRSVVATAISGDCAAFATAAQGSISWAAFGVGFVVSTGAATAGYLTSER